jgi:hypothetical protein
VWPKTCFEFLFTATTQLSYHQNLTVYIQIWCVGLWCSCHQLQCFNAHKMLPLPARLACIR